VDQREPPEHVPRPAVEVGEVGVGHLASLRARLASPPGSPLLAIVKVAFTLVMWRTGVTLMVVGGREAVRYEAWSDDWRADPAASGRPRRRGERAGHRRLPQRGRA